jgi:hypothetical protein
VRQARHSSDPAGRVEWAIRPYFVQGRTDGEEVGQSADGAQECGKVRLGPGGGVCARQTDRQVGTQSHRTILAFLDEAPIRVGGEARVIAVSGTSQTRESCN